MYRYALAQVYTDVHPKHAQVHAYATHAEIHTCEDESSYAGEEASEEGVEGVGADNDAVLECAKGMGECT